MEKSVEDLIKFEIDTLQERSRANWTKDAEKKAIPYTVKTLENLLTTLRWNSDQYNRILNDK